MTTQTITWESGTGAAPPPPEARGLPVLGSALDFLNRPMELFLENYRSLGPIFRIRALNQNYVVLAGLEANLFLAQAGEEYLTSEPLFGDFAREMGAENFTVALDGDPHRHLRRIQRYGYSKQAMAPHLDTMYATAQKWARSWPQGETFPVRDQVQRIVFDQLGPAVANHDAYAQFEEVRYYFNTLMNVFTIKLWPRFMLYSPRYRRSKKVVHEMGMQVLAEHAEAMGGRSRDLIDDMLAAKDLHGNPFSEGDLLGSTIGPFFAGLDTVANTQSFLLYALHKHPETLARVQAEIDEHFSGDELPPMRQLHEFKALYGAVLETLRMYPVAPFTPRGASKPFTFAGHRVEAGEQVMIANGLTHFLPQYFPEPQRFDIDRYSSPRDEHHQGAGIFAPYTLGAHTCLGAGVAELQLMITTAAILRTVRLAFSPPDYQLKIIMTPIPSPEWGFKMRAEFYD